MKKCLKKCICLLMVVLCLMLHALPATAEAIELRLLGLWAPFFAYQTGADLCITTWCPLPEDLEAERCFVVSDGYDREWEHLFTATLSCGQGEEISREELLAFLTDQFGWSEEKLLQAGYVSDEERYVCFKHYSLTSMENVETGGYMNLLIYAAPEGFRNPGCFHMTSYTTTTSADGMTINGMMRNDGRHTSCVQEITGALLVDMKGNGVLTTAEGKTPLVGIEAGERTPVTFTAQVAPGFDLMTVIPVCTVVDDNPICPLPRREKLELESSMEIGASGEFCFRYSVAYIEGTDPADYYMLSQAWDLDTGILTCQWFMPGEGVLKDGRVVFPLVPAYIGADAMALADSAYLIVRDKVTESTK